MSFTMINSSIERAYIDHCDRMRKINARPLKYRVFVALVEEILLDDVMADIRAMHEEY